MINDWTGHKYVTTHRCFGEPCPKDQEKGLVQVDENSESEQSDEDDEMQIFLERYNLHPSKLA